MIKDADAQRCMGFLEVVRTMIDNAELQVAAATTSDKAEALLSRAGSHVAVASKNLVWVSEEIVRIALEHREAENNGASVDGVSAGRTVVSTEEMGRDQVPSGTASTAKYPA